MHQGIIIDSICNQIQKTSYNLLYYIPALSLSSIMPRTSAITGLELIISMISSPQRRRNALCATAMITASTLSPR